MLNDPFRGGTHLPDITLVAPVYVGRAGKRRPKQARARGRGAAGMVPIFMWLRARIMRMWAELMPGRWGCAARFIRKACGFLR